LHYHIQSLPSERCRGAMIVPRDLKTESRDLKIESDDPVFPTTPGHGWLGG